MIKTCQECGNKVEVMYPELWRYKRGSRYLCSWKCLRLYDQKGSEDMEKMKKDGMPAKKPGRKPKMITDPDVEAKLPEEAPVVPEKKPAFEYRTTGIDTGIGTFNYFKQTQYLDWTDLNGETVSMTLEEWKEFMRIWPQMLKVLGVEL